MIYFFYQYLNLYIENVHQLCTTSSSIFDAPSPGSIIGMPGLRSIFTGSPMSWLFASKSLKPSYCTSPFPSIVPILAPIIFPSRIFSIAPLRRNSRLTSNSIFPNAFSLMTGCREGEWLDVNVCSLRGDGWLPHYGVEWRLFSIVWRPSTLQQLALEANTSGHKD